MATFTCLEDMHTALQIPIVFGNEESPNSVVFQKIEDIKSPLSEDTQNDIKRHTLQVIDIPLNLKAASVCARFKRYGEIMRLTMRTRGLFQHAYIEYSSPDGLAHFYTSSWSDTLGHDIVRVLPLALPQEEREKRQLYCFKLASLPPNTQSVDIVKYITSIGGKTCFIPRNPSNYKPLNYAYVNFESEEIQANAALTEHSYKGHVLYWHTQDTPTCHRCGSADHLFKSCPNKVERSPCENKLTKLYNCFRPAQHKKSPRSYADAAKKGSKPNNNNKQQQLKNGTKKGGSIYDKSSKSNPALSAQLEEFRKSLQEISKTVTGFANEIKALKSAINSAPQNSSSSSHNKGPNKRPHLTSSSDDNSSSHQERLSGLESGLSGIIKSINSLTNFFSMFADSQLGSEGSHEADDDDDTLDDDIEVDDTEHLL
ncbi:hypothetical protein C1645_824211 [Glomus cerebriforme]|uniref:CCHC-type domain-containing protein n=1 Tax=Glomus cerebriforme TaxID=658196 RepID=A0A397SUG8_9GLOM|nr:hypothetical protein C1645_824211 [Glomus cerebriforme]